MQQMKLFIPTQKSAEEVNSTSLADLLIKGGYLRPMANGEYAYLPLANRILQKLETMLREELQKIDANELRFSVTNELVKASAYSLTDHHRQLITDLTLTDLSVIQFLSREIQSYRQLPLTFFQIQTVKVSEEKQAKTLLHESHALFVDGYFMHVDEAGLDEMYQRLLAVFSTFLQSCQLKYRSVVDEASLACRKSRVFIGETHLGKEALVIANQGDYAALRSMAKSYLQIHKTHEVFLPLATVSAKQADELQKRQVPALAYRFYQANDELVMVFYLAEDQLSISKMKHYFQTDEMRELSIEEAHEIIGNVADLSALLGKLRVIADVKTQQFANYYLDLIPILPEAFYPINLPTDLAVSEYADLHLVQIGDAAPENQGELVGLMGNRLAQIETYQLLATSELLSKVTNDENEQIPVYLGHYAMNLSEIFALIAEQCRKQNQFIWPAEIAPYDVHLLQMHRADYHQSQLVEEIYQILQPKQYDILLDQRDERVGVKFAEADLIGCPIRIIVGKKAIEGVVELFLTNQNVQVEVRKDDLLSTLAILLGEM
ncbi:proline--tRNA ligase [Enterococcus columbae]|uniref:Anticodon-binding domain-containing protein n=1 Tax=Enterococcus columbae DSM 7374 = ATCC 51263 TaxID=1121865 RepID=S0KUQ3_9ENTE|nr:His/Gly/Thr/Pro-type tRNA ligase C-terminal domain-containing protein [Enterococcus columbae]EOT42916.1 hypothetical protein OMW_00894 [Enterococcus columbae DSM 7374 = ATCC 51263]EOW87647.1 hypothetical protein I568_00312 [Enterococcus columbae DSM 7374 = ATCC 51263]OJG24694.1 hypothetical protein RR47_GL002288 [Enterococcus columbae DSM 7374 = ATCC 51263]